MFNFVHRNLMLFFKDKVTVVLSFLAEFIVIVLYILFIRDNLLEGFAGIKRIDLLTDVWMIGGILGIVSVTTTMGVYGIMVEDRARKIRRDFRIMPISDGAFLGGYMISAVIIGLFLSVLTFFMSQIYILQVYHILLRPERWLLFYGALVIITVSNSAFVLFGVSFLKSSNALASCCTIVGALIGFLTGIYLPMGNLPSQVQWLVQSFSVSHGVVILRQMLMESIIEQNIGIIGSTQAVDYMEYMGVQFYVEGAPVKGRESMLLLIFTAITFMSLSIIKMKREREE